MREGCGAFTNSAYFQATRRNRTKITVSFESYDSWLAATQGHSRHCSVVLTLSWKGQAVSASSRCNQNFFLRRSCSWHTLLFHKAGRLSFSLWHEITKASPPDKLLQRPQNASFAASRLGNRGYCGRRGTARAQHSVAGINNCPMSLLHWG
jgi:hypothetical protein